MKRQLFKKTIACALAVAMTVSLAACGKSSSGGGQANVSGLDEKDISALRTLVDSLRKG